ncbi:aldo/keto reductase [Nocardia lasii]|uniref:Aldo/keto reductase n=1 Tax=Nocardia lasii TaxID=1616107 RepID=A0ABW1JP38_9NOCA
MRRAALGPEQWEVSAQGLGCMRMGLARKPTDFADAADVIGHALDRGVTFLDTAQMYGDGYNESLVGRAVRGRRDEVQLCTKFGVIVHPDGTWTARGDAAFVRQSCDANLERLDVDVIDLYYLHRRDPRVPIEESVGAMADLVAAGKVRYLGLSEVTGDELRAAHAVHPITAVQSQWSLFSRGIEKVVPVCAELGVGVVPFAPRGTMKRVAVDGTGAQLPTERAAFSAGLGSLARKYDATPGQIALAWLHQRARVWNVTVVPIPGTTRADHLDENIAALDIVLDDDDLSRLDGPPASA